MTCFIKRLTGSIALAIMSCAVTVQASTFPNRTIELTVPYGAGGITDVIARRLAQGMEKELGTTIVVTNRPGAQGTLQAGHLARANPDGYTIGLLGFSAVTYVPHLMSNPPYALADFTPLGGVGSYAYGLVTSSQSPIKTVDDMIAASQQPDGVSYAVTGAPNNVAFARFKTLKGGQFEEVLYKSGAEATTAAAGKHVDVSLQNPPDFMAMLKKGDLRLLASASAERINGFPDVPTFQELGYDVVVTSKIGLAAPTGIPEDVQKKLEAALIKTVASPEFAEFMQAQYMHPIPIDGATYKAQLVEGVESMKQLITDLRIPMIN